LFSVKESFDEMVSQLSLGGVTAWWYKEFPSWWSVSSISSHAVGGGVAWYPESFLVHSMGYDFS
jgi:hypothetical protein